ncbi:MAG: hypothetical protein ABI690_11055 [Chloroflexota bacterium]
MITQPIQSQSSNRLQWLLYSGIALIVISMLFLGREQQSASFLVQAMTVMVAPAIFYLVGVIVCRYLNTVLAGPGIVATGGWLVAVGLIHLYEKQPLLPPVIQPYYWLIASLIGAVLMTLTGHKLRIWLLAPLIPLTQANAMWAIMGVSGLNIEWWSAASFGLILVWWEFRPKDERWGLVYKVAAVVLTIFLLIFSYWLNGATPRTVFSTWAAGAILVTILGLRHGWVNLGPLAIVMLVCASLFGLPMVWWPFAWLTLGVVTIVFIERLTHQQHGVKHSIALEMSTALAVILCGLAAVYAKVATMFGVPIPPLMVALIFLESGVLLLWLAWRRGLTIAAHIGLWLLASTWAEIYFYCFSDSQAYGLWLGLLASVALLVERLLSSQRKMKRKQLNTITETVLRWPLADVVIGLSVMIVIWTTVNILDVPPMIIAITTAVVVAVWIVTGLIYRLPVLLHIALWLALLPFSLLLILLLPGLRSLPLLGFAWQGLGLIFVVLGFSLPKQRPAVLYPFFLAGYAFLGIGLTFTVNQGQLLLLSLGLVALVSLATSLMVILGYHPAWDVFVERLISPDERPYAFKNIHNLFLLLGSWLTVIWLQLMLGTTVFSFAQQGVVMVGLSCVWITLGRLLPRVPGVVGWPVYGAGWFMWIIGLLQVFFAPTEALFTIIIGLAICAEALYRSREIYWIPVFIVQILFTALQIAWIMALPGQSFLLLVMIAISLVGMRSRHVRVGQITAATGALLTVAIWVLKPDLIATLGLGVLALGALVAYRRWQWLFPVYVVLGILGIQTGIISQWPMLLIGGMAQIGVGSWLLMSIRPRRYRTLIVAFRDEWDWASPFLWIGSLCAGAGLWLALTHLSNISHELLVFALLTLWMTLWAGWIRLRHAPYIPLALAGGSLFLAVFSITNLSFALIGNGLSVFSIGLTLTAAILWSFCLQIIAHRLPPAMMRALVWWVRPLLKAVYCLMGLSVAILLVAAFYPLNQVNIVVNGLLLTALSALIYWRGRRVVWLILAVAMAWLTWTFGLKMVNLDGIQWHTIPLAILLLALARIRHLKGAQLMEGAAVAILLAGGFAGIRSDGVMSAAGISLVVQLLALVCYGYIGGRRVPFTLGLLILGGGLIAAIIKINFWLILLSAGIIFLGGALLMEVQRKIVVRWYGDWKIRWQGWQ